MSFNIASFSNKKLNGYLKTRSNNIDKYIDILTAQKVNGSVFFALKYEMLISYPLNFPVRPALKLTELIKEIQEEQQIKKLMQKNNSLKKELAQLKKNCHYCTFGSQASSCRALLVKLGENEIALKNFW
ncbi:hypothetical protein RhiirA4_455841 [Rhizophagus irregularis]|uniref:Uncharacterized protein n=1 Tax=Rhizophagus irregularis TaxID=588596 RepID=A0A2I1G662_9GLOM|nr:hypothetical protein RhiirA4_455841 [Rhizophagus irregularis]